MIAATPGCKVREQRRESRTEMETSYGLTATMDRMGYSLWQDSLSRMWFFTTDRAFRFHPDSGLMGHSGTLLAQESNSWAAEVQLRTQDSLASYGLQTELAKASAKRSSHADVIWAIAVGVIVLLVFFAKRTT